MSSSGSSIASSPSDNGWDDWTEEATPAHSLFDEKVFGTPEQALEYDKAVHGVDLALLAATLGGDAFLTCHGEQKADLSTVLGGRLL